MKKNKLLIFVLLVFIPFFAWSYDFGLILDQGLGVGGFGGNPNIDYAGMLIPRFSAPIGEKGDIYVSAGLKAEYGPWKFVPELLRTEFNWNFGNSVLTAGRMYYSDPSGFAADGLFDGIRYSFDTNAGTFGAGVWYTGLLYKKRANIAMNSSELASMGAVLKYSDFFDTYFAPRRLIAAFDWEHPGLGELVRLKLALLGQFDFNDLGDFSNGVHSQYLSGKMTIPFNTFVLDFGLCVELAQISGNFRFALAGEAGAVFDLPTRLRDQLSILARYSSGTWEDSSFTAFLPITSGFQGNLLKARFSGISLISANYLVRFTDKLALEGTSSYFIRNDLGTFQLYGSDGYFLGNEFFARFYWNPFSDLQMDIGAGIFLPMLGNAAPKSDILWRVELNLILSLF